MQRLLLLSLLIFQACDSDHDHHDHKDHDHKEHDHAHHKDTHSRSHDHDHGHHSSGSLAAHSHGELYLSMAVDDNELAFHLTGSSEALIGFEHDPKTEAQKSVFQALEEYWSSENILNVFDFSKNLNCHTHHSSVNLRTHGNHAEIDINGHIMCNQPIQEVVLSSDFMKNYENLLKLRVDVLPTNVAPFSRSFEKGQRIELEL